MARRRPQLAVRGQALLHENVLQAVPDRRHAADSEAGLLAHELGVGLADGLADPAGEALQVNPARARRHHQQRRSARRAEHQRIGDLADLAAEEAGRRCGGARRARQLDDLGSEAGALERRAHARDARRAEDRGGHRGREIIPRR
jgi:hypothetical protein